MQGLVQDRLEFSERLEFHLDRCLACRACEDVCPSNVHYGQLIDSTRILIQQRHPQSPGRQLLRYLFIDPLIAHKSLLRFCARVLRIYQRSGLRWLFRKSGLLRPLGLRRMENILPDIPPQSAWREFYPPLGEQAGDVALFTGCISSILDRDAINAAIELLRCCGYGVHVPKRQGCCGALHLHNGMADQARHLAQDNLAVFNDLDVDAVVFTSSGCGATLAEYPLLQANNKFAAPVMDICQFLNDIEWPAAITFKPLNERIVIHDPCSLHHVLHQENGPYTLLQKIPGATLDPLPDNDRCCGAAGSYMMSQPAMADSLLDDKIKLMKQSAISCLVTSNIGCALHLMAGIREENLHMEIIHPVTILARQLDMQKTY